MAFQGFAREQGFSNHQIDIDIASVINSDLKEADRQSKFMAKNAQMAKEHSNTYLKALMDKHRLEEENRRRNFKFFMKNRENINEQIKYNNEVKYKEAGINRHVKGLDSILGEGLLQLATEAGSAAISKHFSDQKKAQDIAKKEAIGEGKFIWAQTATDAGKKELARLTQLHKDKGLDAVTAELANPNNPLNGSLITADRVAHWSGLEKIQREQIQYSPETVAAESEQWAWKQTINTNGVDFTLGTITESSVSAETRADFFYKLGERYYNEFVPSDINGISQGTYAEQWEKLTNSWQHDSYKTQIASAKLAQRSRNLREIQIAFEQGGARGVRDWVRGSDDDGNPVPGSPVGYSNRTESTRLLIEAFEGGLFNVEALNEIGNELRGNSPLTLAEQLDTKTPSALAVAWRKAREDGVDQGHRDYEIDQDEMDLKGRELMAGVGDMPKKSARALWHSLRTGTLKGFFNNLSTDVQKDLLQTVSNQAGITKPVTTLDPSWEAVPNVMNNTERKSWFTMLLIDQDGNRVDASTLKGSTLSNLDYIFSDWLAGQIKDIGGLPTDPIVKSTILRKLNQKGNEEVEWLKERMRIQTIDPETNQIYPDGPKLIDSDFPTRQSTGVPEYDSLVANNPSQKIPINQINFTGSKGFVEQVDTAIRAGDAVDQQNMLSHQDPLMAAIIANNPDWSAGYLYNAAARYFNKQGMDYQLLSEGEYLKPAQVRQLHKDLNISLRANPGLKATVANNNHRRNATASYLTWKGNKNAYTSAVGSFERLGFQIGGHPTRDAGGTNTYTDPAHSATGDHPLGQAFDITHQTGDYNESIRLTKRLKEALRMRGLFAKIIGPGDGDPKHATHIHAGRLTRPITKEDEAFIQSYVFGNNKLDTPITYGDTSVTGASGKTFNLVDPHAADRVPGGVSSKGGGKDVVLEKEGIDVTNKLLGVGDAVLNTLLPGNPFDLDRRGN